MSFTSQELEPNASHRSKVWNRNTISVMIWFQCSPEKSIFWRKIIWHSIYFSLLFRFVRFIPFFGIFILKWLLIAFYSIILIHCFWRKTIAVHTFEWHESRNWKQFFIQSIISLEMFYCFSLHFLLHYFPLNEKTERKSHDLWTEY